MTTISRRTNKQEEQEEQEEQDQRAQRNQQDQQDTFNTFNTFNTFEPLTPPLLTLHPTPKRLIPPTPYPTSKRTANRANTT